MNARQEDVTFQAGGAVIAGTLSLPFKSGCYPAVALIDGAGATTRDSGMNPILRAHLSRADIAVLCWDKPGVGDSSGDWTHQSVEDRAREALAAIRFVQQHPEVDSSHAGLLGFSQGGWVAPLAASLSRDVAFIITVSGPGVDVGTQNAYDVANTLEAAGYSDDKIRELVKNLHTLSTKARSGSSFDEVEPLLRDPRNRPLLEHFQISDDMLVPMWGFLQRLARYDPAPALSGLHCPVLAIFGAEDRTVPVAQSVAEFKRGMAGAGNRDLTVRIFPGANHGMRVDTAGTLAPGFLESIACWVLERRLSSSAASSPFRSSG